MFLRLKFRTYPRVLFFPILGFTLFFATHWQDIFHYARHSRMAVITVISSSNSENAPPSPPLHVDFVPPYSRRSAHFRKPPVLPSHEYRSDGLLVVNPDARHPIFDLIRRADDAWSAKLNRASKSLPQAVSEYRRRYKRSPPPGFDRWWEYVEKHNVQLPDEYDQIHKDLEPFWGMDPHDLRRIQADWESHQDSYTLGKVGDKIAIVNFTLNSGDRNEILLTGGREIIDLLRDVQHFIPAFRAVFSPHDNPNLPVDHELRALAVEAAAKGKYIDVSKPPPTKHMGWISACPPTSPARRVPLDLTQPAAPSLQKSFIYDHALSMDPCLHPTHLVQHGQFLVFKDGPIPHQTLIPQFSYSPSPLHQDIVTAMPINWVDDIHPSSADPEWEEKLDKRLLWRGGNTGIWHAADTRWREAQRVRMVTWANDLNGTTVVLKGTKTDGERVGKGVEMGKNVIKPGMLDVTFAGEPSSCEPAVCEELAELFDWRKRQEQKAAGQYKYVLDVDGHAWSSRFKRLITSKSLVFKSTIYPEWFADRIAPWLHYVPVKVDLSDVHDSLFFFRGDMDGEGAHDDLARKIAMAGREWSKTFWRKEDLTAYMFRLFLEYGRVMSVDRDGMSYGQSA